MTHRTEPNVLDRIVELLAEYDFDGLANILQLLLNQAMLVNTIFPSFLSSDESSLAESRMVRGF